MNPNFAFIPEPAPRDFSARLRRSKVKSLRAAKTPRHYGRRALVLLSAVALPAFAAPNDWHGTWSLESGNGHLQDGVAPMPFEKPGDSFPGSAFYYLTGDPAPRSLDQNVHSDAEPAPTQFDPLVGPAARAIRVDNSGVDRSRALQCMTAAIYYEAASEPDDGQRAVAQVVLNRVAHPAYPKTVCGVVFQGSEKSTGCQFSFACDGALARVPNRMFWTRAEAVAAAALSGYVFTPIGLATHYHTAAVHPYWSDTLTFVGQIGAHRFYRFAGPAGAPATFRFAYLGGEPLAQPNPRSAAPAVIEAPAADPVTIQKAYENGLKAAQGSAFQQTAGTPVHMAPAPIYSAELQSRGGDALYRGDKLPGTTGVLPEYQQSGAWIAQPN